MRRTTTQPRPGWQATVESQGFHFHSPDEEPYWDESVYYRFTRAEIDTIEAATYALDRMCLDAVQFVIDQNFFDPFQIPPAYIEWIKRSWDRDEITLVGRFDLRFDGNGLPKLLEYNADTPTSLLEASVIQWNWMKDVFKSLDQFNSIHEKLIDAWKRLGKEDNLASRGVHFSCISGNLEDFMTTQYLRDTAMQAGLTTNFIEVERLGWNESRHQFLDETEAPIYNCFKLYPWEWMVRERFGPPLTLDTTRWFEPPWKMLLSNKAILAVMWQLFPGNPYLLPASFEPLSTAYVRKPIYSREGANIQVVVNGQTKIETEGDYEGPFVYQQYDELPNFDGRFPVIGSWMVNGNACGMGIREDSTPITQNMSRFVPHVFE